MFNKEEIIRLFPNDQLLGPKDNALKGISTDSRTIRPGELFIPLKGKNFDGRKFIPQVLKRGCFALKTTDGLTALHRLASRHRRKFNLPVIAVTGSSGKTTTKEMIALILAEKMKVLKNELNLNNEVGVPLTLLKLNKTHQAAVIEMGMQGRGEIALLVDLARPTIAVVTNIGEAHLQQLKNRKNIAKAKAEIFRFLRKNDIAVINQDDEFFEHLIKLTRSRVITFGLLEKASVTPKLLKGVTLRVPGEHIIYDSLAAIAVARILKIDRQAIKRGLENFLPLKDRMHAINRDDGVKIINDTYNANPQSMAAALKVLGEISPAGQAGQKLLFKRVAVLGSMLELGKGAGAAHRKVLSLAQGQKIDNVLTLGNFWPKSSSHFSDKARLISYLRRELRPFDIVLVKGSRGMKMEEVVEKIKFA